MEIGTGGGDCHGQGLLAGPEQAAGPAGLSGGLYSLHQGSYHRPINLVPRLDVRGDRGLVLIQGVVVIQDGSGDDDAVGKIPLVQGKFLQGAEHAVGEDAPEFSLLNLYAAREGGLVEGHRYQIPYMDVPGAGDDLDRFLLAHVQLAYPHVVAVGVAFHGDDAAYHYIGNLRSQILGGLYLGPGEGHGFSKVFIIGINADELVEPLSA